MPPKRKSADAGLENQILPSITSLLNNTQGTPDAKRLKPSSAGAPLADISNSPGPITWTAFGTGKFVEDPLRPVKPVVEEKVEEKPVKKAPAKRAPAKKGKKGEEAAVVAPEEAPLPAIEVTSATVVASVPETVPEDTTATTATKIKGKKLAAKKAAPKEKEAAPKKPAAKKTPKAKTTEKAPEPAPVEVVEAPAEPEAPAETTAPAKKPAKATKSKAKKPAEKPVEEPVEEPAEEPAESAAPPAPAPKKKAASKAKEAAPKEAPAKKSKNAIPEHVTSVYLPGQETDSVPVFDTCDVIRRKITGALSGGAHTKASLLRALAASTSEPDRPIPANSFGRFLAAKGKTGGCQNRTFYAAYVYFEKQRIAEKKKKTKVREEMEEAWGENGMDWENLGKHVIVHGSEMFYSDKYGREIIRGADGKEMFIRPRK